MNDLHNGMTCHLHGWQQGVTECKECGKRARLTIAAPELLKICKDILSIREATGVGNVELSVRLRRLIVRIEGQ